MYVKPVDGKKIPDPFRRGMLPVDGANIDKNEPYWQRRLADGDVVEVELAKAKKPGKDT